MTQLVQEFKEYHNISEDWVNTRWLGRGLTRLNLNKEKRRIGRGIEVKVNIEKAKSQVKQLVGISIKR